MVSVYLLLIRVNTIGENYSYSCNYEHQIENCAT